MGHLVAAADIALRSLVAKEDRQNEPIRPAVRA